MALALSAAASTVLAEDDNGKGLRPFATVGFTWGGQTIEPVTITPQGSSTHYQEDISAGAGLALQLGLSYHLDSTPFTLQTSYGYHNDQATGINGHFSFRRRPVELLVQYSATDRTRLGFGVRRSTRARFAGVGGTCDDAGTPCNIHAQLKGSTGLVFETEWMATSSWSLKARWVHEYFHFEDSTDFDNNRKYKGDHFGLMTSYYFD
ncbi:MAG: hypothetical protein QM749_02440 [Aquabacterium sp.]